MTVLSGTPAGAVKVVVLIAVHSQVPTKGSDTGGESGGVELLLHPDAATFMRASTTSANVRFMVFLPWSRDRRRVRGKKRSRRRHARGPRPRAAASGDLPHPRAAKLHVPGGAWDVLPARPPPPRRLLADREDRGVAREVHEG